MADKDALKEFMKTFDGLTGRWNRYQIWQDFIWLTACAISNTVDEANRAEREEMYLHQAQKYTGEELMRFSSLFAILAEAMDDRMAEGDWGDFLGDLYMRLELGNDRGGQFFTPYHLCSLMARSIIDADLSRAEIRENGFISLNEPSCGAGGTLIAAAEEMQKQGIDFQRECLFVAQDIDFTTAMMCYIQLSLLGCAGYVRVGDTLNDPPTGDVMGGPADRGAWYTPMYFSADWAVKMRTKRQLDIMKRINAMPKPQARSRFKTETGGQMTFV